MQIWHILNLPRMNFSKNDNLVERFPSTKILTAAQALDVKLVWAGLLGTRAYFKESL